MTEKIKGLEPEVIRQVVEAAAAAKEDVLKSKTLETLLKAKRSDLVAVDDDAEVLRSNAYAPGCWIHSPAMVELFASADQRLTRIAHWAGMVVKQVDRVHAERIDGTQIVIITPAAHDDRTALPIKRKGSTATFNLRKLLGAAGIRIQPGYRERYDVAYVPRESALWPALLIDLGDMKERRLEPKSDKQEEEESAETATAQAENKGRKGSTKGSSKAQTPEEPAPETETSTAESGPESAPTAGE